ncbi:uncharacterized protein P884DRAFT_250583 [Thermothelomyces heterothallicus CBS 202.75]|uniref:uncharacterized protein n=1 Tax=Thermothelomyces heterothallicus CBS 202.75 TaxID=1149848 RepID=UPI0037435CC6
MVGVPGRSKACITCRKRRKGCDLERPACSQCRKAGLQCEGYSAPRVFVISTPERRRAGYSTRRDSPSGPDADGCSTEEERRCLDLFWEAYFPAGQPIPSAASRSYVCAWTETARRFYRDDDSLRYALWANCLLTTGRRHGAAWMLREGSKAYGKALGDLRRSLQASPHRVRVDVPIATIKLLAMFEVGMGAGEPKAEDAQQHWQRHYAGELALFVARTPVAHVDGELHDVFADERVDMVSFVAERDGLDQVLRRERLVLSTPEWKTIPWRAIPKDYKDILVDALVDIPGLVEDFDKMRLCAEEPRRSHLRLDLVRKCRILDRQLQTWVGLLTRLGAKVGEHSCLDPTGKDLVTHVAQVHGMSLYWAASLVLYTILRLVSGPRARLPEHADPPEHARNLVAAVAILLEPGSRLYGRQNAALPLEIAWQYADALRPVSRDGEALLGTIRALRRRLHTGPAAPVGDGASMPASMPGQGVCREEKNVEEEKAVSNYCASW